MSWVVGAARDLPVNKDMAWDGPASAASIFAAAGWPDHPQPSKAARGFLVHNTDDPELKSSFKLPFARVIDGTLTCLSSGIRAAASRLPQADIPADVQTQARAVIDAYEKKWADDGAADGEHAAKKKAFPGAAPEFGSDDDDADGKNARKPQQPKAAAEGTDGGDEEDAAAGGGGDDGGGPKKPAIPAKPKPRPWQDITAAAKDQDVPDDDLEGITGDSSRPAGETRGELLIMPYRVPIVTTRGIAMTPEEQEKAAFDPDIFASNPPYTFRAQISNDQLDAYHTRMHSSSLRNYAKDAQDGVALQNSHRSDDLPMGHSFRGRYSSPGAQGDQIAKTHADFYVVPGVQLSEVHNDHLINAIRSGTVRDVSVGFYGGRYRCTLCNEFWRADLDGCQHIPGLYYRVKRAGGDEEEQPAAAWVHDARLAEVSTVYDGATPGATIVKAQRMAECGRLSPVQARLLEARYRIKLYGSQRYFNLDQHITTPDKQKLRAAQAEIAAAAEAARENRMREPWPKTHDASAGMPYQEQEGQGIPTQDGVTKDLRELLDEAGLEATEDPWQGLRSLIRDYTRLKQTRTTDRAAPSLEERRLIEDGRAYRTALVERALNEGVRALGPEFDRDYQQERLALLAPAAILQETKAWSQIGDRLFPGGRQNWTDQEIEKGRPPRTAPIVPDDAYRG